jgi:hypothetical protein
MPLISGARVLVETVHPGDGGQESLTTQYFIFLPSAFFWISSAVTTETLALSLAAMPEQ